jgi:hypothetical protein
MDGVSLQRSIFTHKRTNHKGAIPTNKENETKRRREKGGREGGREKTTGKDMDENKCLIHTNEQ